MYLYKSICSTPDPAEPMPKAVANFLTTTSKYRKSGIGGKMVEPAIPNTPPRPERKELTEKEDGRAVSMIQGMMLDDQLPHGCLTTVAKTFGVACSTIGRLWERALDTRVDGLINSPGY